MADYTLGYTGAQVNTKLGQIKTEAEIQSMINATIAQGVTKSNGAFTVTKESSSGEGGQINFAPSLNTTVGCLDLVDTSSTSSMRVHADGWAFRSLNLKTGQTTGRRNDGISQLFIKNREATWFSNVVSASGGAVGHFALKTTSGAWALVSYNHPSDTTIQNSLYFVYGADANYGSNTNTVKHIHLTAAGGFVGATYNDYAETRKTTTSKPGTCVYEMGDGTMSTTTSRLMRGCKVISDTYGTVIGEQSEGYNPIAVAGRVLTYVHEGREAAQSHIGWPVCSGPDSTVSIMTEEEERLYPSRIVGTISEVPTYEIYGDNDAKVDGRVWIYVK